MILWYCLNKERRREKRERKKRKMKELLFTEEKRERVSGGERGVP